MTMTTADVLPSSVPSRAHSNRRRSVGYSKGLSLNFPILSPPGAGAGAGSGASTAGISSSSARARAETCPQTTLPLSLPVPSRSPSPTKTGNDILTLVAAQERRVLELREELDKAESELGNLKKKWTLYEANRKRDEVRAANSRSMAMPLEHIPLPRPLSGDGVIDIEEERRRRRALIELSQARTGGASASTGTGRKTSPRIFQGSHTRTLSLLSHQPSPTRPFPSISSPDSLSASKNPISPKSPTLPEESTTVPSLDGFISLVPRPQSFGQRYKDLAAAAAAQQKSLSPTSADALIKSGKQVVDGVRDGLWTFFEDIRQATVGDEAIKGPSPNAPNSRQRRSSKLITTASASPSSQANADTSNTTTSSSFWTEFGLDSPAVPKKPGESRRPRQETRHRNKDNKSSTSSQNVPDLLLDDASDEEWEQWGSPVSNGKNTHESPTTTTPPATEGHVTTSLNDSLWPGPDLDKANNSQPKGLNIKHAI